jgi:hypothetical protein
MGTVNYPEYKPEAPNATAILVLGIISIVFCGIGLITGIIALAISKTTIKEIKFEPNRYSAASIGNIRTGRTCAIIGISISSLFILFYIVYFVFLFSVIGGAVLMNGAT